MDEFHRGFSLRKVLFALATLLDYVEQDILKGITHHGRKVAYTSLQIGKHLDLDDQQLFDLTAYALLHDIGIIEHKYPPAKEQTDRLNLERDYKHCESGQRILSSFHFLTGLENVILYHHEYENASGPYKKPGHQVPLMARIIVLADYLDTQLYEETSIERARTAIRQQSGIRFSPLVADAFLKASSNITFWEDLAVDNISYAIDRVIPPVDKRVSLKEFSQTAETISAMVDGKSKFTSHHVHGIAQRAYRFAQMMKFSEEHSLMFYIAALLHDIGKLIIPNQILEKEGKLTDSEFYRIKRHPYYTEKALHLMGLDPRIVSWARNHHERLDGSGYPNSLSGDELDFESRALAVLDIYQSLTEERPYRKPLSHEDAIQMLQALADEHKIDRDILEKIEALFHAL